MHHVHIPSLPWDELKSPTGKFHSFCQNITVAMGAARNAGTWAGGHPFDLQIRRIPPGAAVCPFHSHLNQWELFIVIAGEATIRAGSETHTARAGEVFIHPPDEPHQLLNRGSVDLLVYIVADNPSLDACYYPDSNKWALRPPGKFFRMVEVDYFEGEDTGVDPQRPAYRSSGFPPPPPLAPFSTRKIHPDAVPWDPYTSPKQKFSSASKELSIALGAKRNTPTGLGGHPFDLEYGRLSPGFSGCPFHSHATQWEFYIFLRGTASVRTREGTKVMGAGDAVLHPPGEAHQFTNTGTDDVLYYLIADNPSADYWHYPDSNKWGIREPRKIFRMTDVDYWDGEE